MRSMWRAKTAVKSVPLLGAAALFVAAGGFVHARDWVAIYRHVPADLAGAFVVRVGFPVNVAISALLVIALVLCAATRSRFTPIVAAGGLLFQAGALASLIMSRTGSVLGWQEPAWSLGATQSRAMEVGALITLAAVLTIAVIGRPTPAPALVRRERRRAR